MRECQAVLSRDASQLGKRIQLTFLEVQAMEGNSARFSGRKVASGKLGKGGRDVGSAGVHFTQPPADMGPVTMAVLDDICGNLIQIAQKK
jgi:hypothetical protein